MTREDQIIKEAYRQEELVNMNAESFIEGAKWADKNPKSPWISVKDDLPCNHKDLLHLGCYTEVVLVRYNCGVFQLARMNKINNTRWNWADEYSTDITHWMPIPKFEEDLLL